MIINDTVVLTKGLRSEFFKSYNDQAPLGLINTMATVIPSTAKSETYGFFDELPGMSELKDQVQYAGFGDGTYSIVNKEFAGGVKARKAELDDDQTGGRLLLQIRTLAEAAAIHPLSLLFDLLNNGASATLGLCYDGVAFYSSAHPNRGSSGVQDNILDGTGVSVAALKTDIGTAIAQLRTFLNSGGRPFHEMLDMKKVFIVCGPELEQTMDEATSGIILSSTSNVLAGKIGGLIVNQRFTGTNDWDLLYTGKVMKPFILQDRQRLTFVEETTGDEAFNRLLLKWRVYSRGNGGYGMWQNAIRTLNV